MAEGGCSATSGVVVAGGTSDDDSASKDSHEMKDASQVEGRLEAGGGSSATSGDVVAGGTKSVPADDSGNSTSPGHLTPKKTKGTPITVNSTPPPSMSRAESAANQEKKNCTKIKIEVHPTMMAFMMPLRKVIDEDGEEVVQVNIPNVNHNVPNPKKAMEITNNVLGNPINIKDRERPEFAWDMEVFGFYHKRVSRCNPNRIDIVVMILATEID